MKQLKVCNPIGLENKIEGSQKPRCKVGRSHRRQLLKEAKSMNVVDALLSVACPPPVIPVKVYQDADGQWKKEPLRKWNDASTDRDVLEGWWQQWPSALPGIPLKQVGWVAIDLDDAEDEAFKAVWGKPVGPHSKYRTPSGGLHCVFGQPVPPITGRVKWSAGVEVLGIGCLLTVYDVGEILFPRVAPRAVLPEVFRRPYAPAPWEGEWEGERVLEGGGKPQAYRDRSPIKKEQRTLAPRAIEGEGDVAGARDALFALDPLAWRGEHDAWLSLANAAKFEGVSEDDWVRWSVGDVFYLRDEKLIRRKWRSLEPKHSGALWAALSMAGIKVSRNPSPSHSADIKRSPSVFDGQPLSVDTPAKPSPTHNFQARIDNIRAQLTALQTGDFLFWCGCRFGEMLIEQAPTLTNSASPFARATFAHDLKGHLRRIETYKGLLEEACPQLINQIGIAEVRRTINNAFKKVGVETEA
jgi:hypothetical protein